MRTFDGQDAPEGWGHAGLPRCWAEVLATLTRGRVPYRPTDPRAIDQRPYLAFAAERGPNSR